MNSKELLIVQDIVKFQTPTFTGQETTDTNILLEEGPKLIKRIKKKDPKQCSDQFKIQCIQFFIQYYTTRMFLLAPIPTEEQLEKVQMNITLGPPKYPEVNQKNWKHSKGIRLLIWNLHGKC